MSAYPLTIRTSRSRSTKSTAKVKGTLLQHYFLLRMIMYAGSIAYVECGTPANAVAVKNWFDNK